MIKGGFSTSRAVETRAVVNPEAFIAAATETRSRKGCHKDLDPKGKIRECLGSDSHPNATPIVTAMDFTDSRGDDARIIYDRMPEFFGTVLERELVVDPQLCVVGIGDATCDRAPVQVGQWESEDTCIDQNLQHMWIEKGGGGTGRESYELAAYFLAHRTKLDSYARGEKGTLFFLGDEGFYPEVSKEQLERVLGVTVPQDVPSAEVFAALQERFDTFLIFPGASLESRKAGIDNEIRQRITAKGGMVDGVDFQAGLIWETRDDLDLHVVTPSGFEIFYGNRRSPCGGELDVDANAACNNTTLKPAENIRWPLGQAKRGLYKVYVNVFQLHHGSNGRAPTYKIQVNNGGEVKTFEGKLDHEKHKKLIGEFHFDPASSQATQTRYESYDPKKIKAQWGSVIPPEHILSVEDPGCAIDLMIGTLGLRSGKLSLAELHELMRKKGANASHRKQVSAALAGFADLRGAAKAPVGLFGAKKKASATR